MALESLLRPLKEVGKKAVPLMLSLSSFLSPSAYSQGDLNIQWERVFEYGNPYSRTSSRIVQENSNGDYVVFGVLDKFDLSCLPLFASVFSQNGGRIIDTIFPSCRNIISKSAYPYGNGFIYGNTEIYSDSTRNHTREKILITDNYGRTISSFQLPEYFFSGYFPFIIKSNGEIVAASFSENPQKPPICVVNLSQDNPFRISYGWPRYFGNIGERYFPSSITELENGNIAISMYKSEDNFLEISAMNMTSLGIEKWLVDTGIEGVPAESIYELDTDPLNENSDNEIIIPATIYGDDFNAGIIRLSERTGELKENSPEVYGFANKSYDKARSFKKNRYEEFIMIGTKASTPDSDDEQIFILKFNKNVSFQRERVFPSSAPRIPLSIIQDSKESYVIAGNENYSDGLIIKLYPEPTPTPHIINYIPLGFKGNPFTHSVDDYNFIPETVDKEETSKQFIESLIDILESAGELSGEEINEAVYEFLPLIVPYILSFPYNDSYGMSASSIFYFLDPLYFFNDGMGVQMDTYLRSRDDESTSNKIESEQQKYPYIEFARKAGAFPYSSSVEELVNITSRGRPAIVNFLKSNEEENTNVLSTVAYKVQDVDDKIFAYLYNPTYPNQQIVLEADRNSNSISYKDFDSFNIIDPFWTSVDLPIREILEETKELYLQDLIEQGLDILTIFPSVFSKSSDSEVYMITDTQGRRYGYENGVFYNELPIEEVYHGDIVFFYIPSNLIYSFRAGPIDYESTLISLINSNTNEQETRTYVFPSYGSYFNLDSENKAFTVSSPTSEYTINPSYTERNISFYDFNTDNKIDYLDLFSFSNAWKQVSGSSTYSPDFLLKMIESR